MSLNNPLKGPRIMKNLIVLMSLLVVTNVQANSCNLTLFKKKASSKTYYTLKGETISQKIIKKLDCNVTTKYFSASQLRAMKIKRLKKQLNKLKGGF